MGWSDEYLKNGWLIQPNRLGELALPTIPIDGESSSVSLRAAFDGSIVTVRLYLNGEMWDQTRSLGEDPYRAAVLMLDKVKALRASFAMAESKLSHRSDIQTRNPLQNAGAQYLNEGGCKDCGYRVADCQCVNYQSPVAPRSLSRALDGEKRRTDCGETVDGCECGGLRPMQSYG